ARRAVRRGVSSRRSSHVSTEPGTGLRSEPGTGVSDLSLSVLIPACPSLCSSIGFDDDVAVGLLALAARAHARLVLEPQVDDPALDRRHGLELDRLTPGPCALGAPDCQRLQR